MRLPVMRSAFLQYALGVVNPRKDDDEARANANANAVAIDNVRLMLHSENVLSEQGDYVRMACELWADLENLKNVSGWEQKVKEPSRENSLPHLSPFSALPFTAGEKGRPPRVDTPHPLPNNAQPPLPFLQAAIAQIRKRFIIPERGGTKRTAAVWAALRKLVFDPLAQSERDLGDKATAHNLTQSHTHQAYPLALATHPSNSTQLT